MVLLGGTAIWRDQTQRQVSIQISPEADRALLAAGLDMDVRQALIDALNERVRGVEAVAAIHGLVQQMDTDPQPAISFKAFGSALSTDQVTAMVRFLRGSPRPMTIDFDLLCGGRTCADTQGLTEDARLVARMDTPAGVVRTSYPVAPGRGLVHLVRAAIDHTADSLLEHSEPLLAGIYDINAVPSALFADEIQHDIDSAGEAAVKSRGGTPEQACVAHIVTAGTLLMRGQLIDEVGALKQAVPGASHSCRLRIASQIVILLARGSGCDADPAVRDAAFGQLSTLVAKMPAIAEGAPPSLADRVPGSRMFLAAARLMRDTDGGTRMSICTRMDNSRDGRSFGLAQGVTTLLAAMRRELPPNTSPQYEHLVLDFIKLVADHGVHRDDVVSRYVILHGMLGLVRDYAVAARQPRHLLILQGRLAMDTVWLARDALALPQAEKEQALRAIGLSTEAAANADDVLLRSVEDNLGTARAAFEAAAGAHAATRLEEPSPTIEPLVLLGDTLAVAGDDAGAPRAYANGLNSFIAEGEPVDQLGQVSEAASHWAVLLVAAGGCAPGAPLDEQWEARWSKLGAGQHGACSLLTTGAGSGSSLLDIVRPLAADVVMHCSLGGDAAFQDRQAGWNARTALAECERNHGIGDPKLRLAFVLQDSTAVEAGIARALSSKP